MVIQVTDIRVFFCGLLSLDHQSPLLAYPVNTDLKCYFMGLASVI